MSPFSGASFSSLVNQFGVRKNLSSSWQAIKNLDVDSKKGVSTGRLRAAMTGHIILCPHPP